MKGTLEYKNHPIVVNNGIYGINVDETFITLEHVPTMSGFRGFGKHMPEYPEDINWISFDSVVKLCENNNIIFARFKKPK